MNKLIFALTFLPLIASAQAPVQEISDTKIKNKFLTLVKDAEVEKMITGTAQFQACRKEGEFKSKDVAEREAKLAAANACFKKSITGKNTEALKKLADDLKLQDYGLIKSKNLTDITDYLSKKMTKSLTGVDPDEQDPQKIMEQMKWEKRKIIDQKVFIDLYTNQLMKAALFEVSRFCFENLRHDSAKDVHNFAEHWETVKESGFALVILDINDQGKPSFIDQQITGVDVSDPSKQTEVVKRMALGLSGGKPIDPLFYDKFFNYCQTALPQLCESFKKGVKNSSGKEETTSLDKPKDDKMTNGANACLTVDRLKSIREAMKKTELVVKQFEEMGEDKDKFVMHMLSRPRFYEGGNGENEDSLDEMTSFSSSDMLAKQKKNDYEKLQTECLTRTGPECDEFLVQSNSVDKAINNVELSMNLKREIELEKIKSMKDVSDINKYLEEAGHYEIINKLKADPNLDVVGELSTIYEAKKRAEIEALKLKVGKRQMSDENYKALVPEKKKEQISENIKEAKSERVRMAQVMMFSNIITSQLKLTDKATQKDVGRNVSGWKKELADMEKNGSYDKSLFDGIKETAKDQGSKVENTSVVGGEIIDSILGKKPEPTK